MNLDKLNDVILGIANAEASTPFVNDAIKVVLEEGKKSSVEEEKKESPIDETPIIVNKPTPLNAL